MITIQIFDKHGRELTNDDTIKFVDIKQTFVDIFDPFCKIPDNPSVEYAEESVLEILEQGGGGAYYFTNPWYSKVELCHLFNMKESVDFEEYKECIVDPICEKLGLEYTTEEQFYEDINGFEIVER